MRDYALLELRLRAPEHVGGERGLVELGHRYLPPAHRQQLVVRIELHMRLQVHPRCREQLANLLRLACALIGEMVGHQNGHQPPLLPLAQ